MSKAKRCVYDLLISAVLFFIFSLSLGLSLEFMSNPSIARRMSGFWNDALYLKINFVYAMVAFLALNEYILLRDTELKSVFAEKCGQNGFFGRCIFIFKQSDMWLGYAVFACLFCVFPNSPLRYELSGLGAGAATLPLVLLIAFVLYYAAYLLTLGYWSDMTDKRLRTSLINPVTVKTRLKDAAVLLGIAFALALGGSALAFVCPMISAIVSILSTIGWIPFLITVIAVFFAVYFKRYVRAVILRMKLLRGIKRICKTNGYEVRISHPYRTLFFREDGYQIAITAEGKRYLCRLIGILYKLDPLYFDEDGYASYDKHRVYYRHIVSDRYTFETNEGDTKILLVCPCPQKVYVKARGEERVLDYGDKVLDYTFYNTSGFLNDLKYGCIK